jgi:hypothetical protein
MRGYSIWRPLMLIAVALLTRGLVTNVCILFGMSNESASSLGVLGMIIAGLVVYNRMKVNQRRK